jgi:hypothetical protein
MSKKIRLFKALKFSWCLLKKNIQVIVKASLEIRGAIFCGRDIEMENRWSLEFMRRMSLMVQSFGRKQYLSIST